MLAVPWADDAAMSIEGSGNRIVTQIQTGDKV
jgi:hypothetical protein